MINYCRFCRKSKIAFLFPSNKQDKNKTPESFACTNCGFGLHGPIVKCLSCQIIYVDEKILQSQISTYYEVAKDPLYFAEQEARQRTFDGYLNRLEKVFPKKGKLLDIGTNTGLFVRLAKNRGWDAFGLEPNHWAVEYAKKNYQINLINKPFEKNNFPKESFDVITMWDVIEHFTDPVSEIKKVYYQLKRDGLFAFSTVNPESLLAKVMGTRWSWYMDMHRVFFSPESAKRYLENTGFKKTTFKSHWRSLSIGYLSSRLIAISQKLSLTTTSLTKLLGVEKKIIPYYANDLYDCYAFK